MSSFFYYSWEMFRSALWISKLIPLTSVYSRLWGKSDHLQLNYKQLKKTVGMRPFVAHPLFFSRCISRLESFSQTSGCFWGCFLGHPGLLCGHPTINLTPLSRSALPLSRCSFYSSFGTNVLPVKFAVNKSDTSPSVSNCLMPLIISRVFGKRSLACGSHYFEEFRKVSTGVQSFIHAKSCTLVWV